MSKKVKKEVAEETALRGLFTLTLDESVAQREGLEIDAEDHANIVDTVLDAFGEAIMGMMEAIVENELVQALAIEEDEDGDGDGDGDDDDDDDDEDV